MASAWEEGETLDEKGGFRKLSASFGPIVAKKVLMWSGIFSGTIGLPFWSLRLIFGLGRLFLIIELISIQNFLGSSLRFSNFCLTKSERAFLSAFLIQFLICGLLGGVVAYCFRMRLGRLSPYRL